MERQVKEFHKSPLTWFLLIANSLLILVAYKYDSIADFFKSYSRHDITNQPIHSSYKTQEIRVELDPVRWSEWVK